LPVRQREEVQALLPAVIPVKLRINSQFQPCEAAEREEIFRNGVFEFNISRLIAFIDAHPGHFALESVPVCDLPCYGDDNLDEETIRGADLSRPILQAEIAPDHFGVIDGHHRIARARREKVQSLPTYRIPCPHHVDFLTSTLAYER